MKASIAQQKSKAFSVRIIRLYQYLCNSKKEYTLARQILRSGTSIGANLAEATSAISKKDFLAKIYIALKETVETLYWLDLLQETGYITQAEFSSLASDCEELRKILSATTRTLQAKLTGPVQ